MRSSLAIIRSLGKAGLDVTAGEETRIATGMFSKYCKHTLVYPEPKNEDTFISSLLENIKTNDYKVIFPATDPTVVPIVKRKKEFSKYTIVPYPDYDTLQKATDKALTIKIALQNEIPCPDTIFPDSIDDIEKIKDAIQYPVVIKPRTSFGSRGITLCRSPEELVSKYPEVCALFGPSMVQEYIPNGGELGVYALFSFDSEPRAVTVQRRIRSYPISGGPSTFRESINYPELIETAFRLLKALKWTGIAMVEFRMDPRDNTPKLMEVNPRFWGSLHLSILSGVDFPYLLYKMVTEGDIKPVMNYQAGIKCRWVLPGDIFWYLSSPHKIKNLPQFLEITNDDILSFRDPGPTIGFTLASMRFMFDRDMWKFMLKKPIEER
jgi:predicted ATP-grasp superfamily ATP-dependent carboligase